MRQLLVVDGSNLLHRILYTETANEENGLHSGFLRSVCKLAREHRNNCSFIVCWDFGMSKFRSEIFPKYKDRTAKLFQDSIKKQKLKEYTKARWEINEFLNAIGILSIMTEGIEADDLIAYSKEYFKNWQKIKVVTEDRDLLQLIDSRVSVYQPIKNKLMTNDNWVTALKLDPDNPVENFIALKAMTGDDSDCVPGIKGIGPTNAQRIYETLKFEGGFKKLQESKLKTDIAFVQNQKIYLRNMKLMDLNYFLHFNRDKLKIIFDKHIRYLRGDFMGGLDWLRQKNLKEVVKQYNTLMGIRNYLE